MSSAALRLDQADPGSFADDLPVGARLLQGQFTIESFLNAGGFGITYIARDSLNRQVVIKECFPSSFCRRVQARVAVRSEHRQPDFRSLVDLFVQEAVNLSRLDHPNIVRVHQVFQDNDTAYMAMDYIRGPDLLETLEGTAPRLRPDQVIMILDRMLDALGHVHAQGFLHRDISPDNILLDTGTGEPVLIDFGAARKDETRKSRALSGLRVVKDGYSPQEFYISGSLQAPCSDLYALAATISHLVTGEAPRTSRERLAAIANRQGDPQLPLRGRIAGYPDGFLAAIDKALAIFPRDRLQSVGDWKAMLDQPASPVAAPPVAASPVAASPVAAPRVLADRPAAPRAPLAAKPQPVPASLPAAGPALAAPLPPQRDRLVRAAAVVVLIAGLASLAGEIYDRFWAPPRDAILREANPPILGLSGESVDLSAWTPEASFPRIGLTAAGAGVAVRSDVRLTDLASFDLDAAWQARASEEAVSQAVALWLPPEADLDALGGTSAMLAAVLAAGGDEDDTAINGLSGSGLTPLPRFSATLPTAATESAGNVATALRATAFGLSAAPACKSLPGNDLPEAEVDMAVATYDVAVQPVSVVGMDTSFRTGATLARSMA